MAYAESTSVTVGKTESEIKTMLRRHGAAGMAFFEDGERVQIAFEMQSRRIIFRLPLPDRDDDKFRLTPSKTKQRDEDGAYRAWEQACRARWRGLYLCIRAKLESVESGIETFEQAFLAHVMMPDGSTVGEHTQPRIAAAYEGGAMQPLLPGPSDD